MTPRCSSSGSPPARLTTQTPASVANPIRLPSRHQNIVRKLVCGTLKFRTSVIASGASKSLTSRLERLPALLKYARLLPSGDHVGSVSTAASVASGVNRRCWRSGLELVGSMNHRTPAATIAPASAAAAAIKAVRDVWPLLAARAVVAPLAVPLAEPDTACRANARSRAD